jgi:hypothetical protein
MDKWDRSHSGPVWVRADDPLEVHGVECGSADGAAGTAAIIGGAASPRGTRLVLRTEFAILRLLRFVLNHILVISNHTIVEALHNRQQRLGKNAGAGRERLRPSTRRSVAPSLISFF